MANNQTARPVNTLTGSGYFSRADIYGGMGVSTSGEAVPEPIEQDALSNTETAMPSKKSTTSIWLWLGIIAAVFLLFHLK